MPLNIMDVYKAFEDTGIPVHHVRQTNRTTVVNKIFTILEWTIWGSSHPDAFELSTNKGSLAYRLTNQGWKSFETGRRYETAYACLVYALSIIKCLP